MAIPPKPSHPLLDLSLAYPTATRVVAKRAPIPITEAQGLQWRDRPAHLAEIVHKRIQIIPPPGIETIQVQWTKEDFAMRITLRTRHMATGESIEVTSSRLYPYAIMHHRDFAETAALLYRGIRSHIVELYQHEFDEGYFLDGVQVHNPHPEHHPLHLPEPPPPPDKPVFDFRDGPVAYLPNDMREEYAAYIEFDHSIPPNPYNKRKK